MHRFCHFLQLLELVSRGEIIWPISMVLLPITPVKGARSFVSLSCFWEMFFAALAWASPQVISISLFLDEIGELPLNAQVRLLRVIQSKEIERVGGTKVVPVDTRIITATHRNLKRMVDRGQFREDLWFRLNVFPITIPPLRQRKNDIPALVQHFIEKKSKETGTLYQPTLESGAMDRLINYHWPGNVRELENLVERALILCRDNILRFDYFETARSDEKFLADLDMTIDSLDHAMTRHINLALKKSYGKIHGPNGAAAILKINPSTLRNRMKKFRICFGRKK